MSTKITPQLRFPEFTDEWQVKKLGDFSSITTGKLDANAMVENGRYRFYTCAREFYKIDQYAFDTEALLVSGNGANVGYIHYYKGKFNAYQRTYVLDNFRENIGYIKLYLDRYLKKRILQEKFEGNMPYIVLSTLKDMPNCSKPTSVASCNKSSASKSYLRMKTASRILTGMRKNSEALYGTLNNRVPSKMNIQS